MLPPYSLICVLVLHVTLNRWALLIQSEPLLTIMMAYFEV